MILDVADDMLSICQKGASSMEDNELDETIPVEETPGYVGNVFDGEFMAGSGDGLGSLSGFDWSYYLIMADELGETRRKLTIEEDGGLREILVEATSIEEIVDALPSVEASYDCPPDQGPAGGSGYIFVVAEGFSITDVSKSASALKQVLDVDFEVLRAEYESG